MTVSPEISSKMREVLVDWLIDVQVKFKLLPQTFFLAVNILDRACEQICANKNNFQLLGITCLFIASKYEEIYYPKLREYSYVCADTYTTNQILQMEEKILKALNFNLVHSSCFSLHQIYVVQSKFIRNNI